MEYRPSFRIINNSFEHDRLSLLYSFIGARFDEELRDDSDTHQLRFDWKHGFTPHMSATIGGGPSYAKSEGQDATWGANGFADFDYKIERGFIKLSVDKRFDVSNFSGTEQTGLVNTWDSRLSLGYQLSKPVTVSGRFSYLYEDRKQEEDIHKDRYIADCGLNYKFWRYYAASVDYQFVKRVSDVAGEDYDEHRVLLTLSWQKELFHW